MNTKNTRNQFFALGLIFIILFSSSCGSSRKLTDYSKEGAELRYRYPIGKELHYATHYDMVQSIVLNEQNIQTDLIQ